MELANIGYDEKKKRFSLDDHQNAVLSGGKLSTPLRAKVRLIDKKFNVPLDERDVVLANVPYMTDDGTFVIKGNAYSVNNQARLRAGVFARTKDSGEMESHINTKSGTGPSMRLFMEPETGVFRASIDKSNIKLYPVLSALGVTDDQLKEAWGDKILEQNRKAWDRGAFNKFYGKMLRHRANLEASDEEKKQQILDRLSIAQLDPEVTTRTLGRPHSNLSMDMFLDASRKLLRVNRGEEEEDDRDHPANRTVHSVDDFLSDRVSKDAGKLGKTLLYRATYDRSLKQLRPGYFTPQLEGLIIGNQLSQLVSGTNPVELYDQHKRVIQLGEGGVGSMDGIPMSSRNLHAGHLGMIDPIRSSESKAIGVDQRFTVSAMKGDDNLVYYPLRNRRTGQIEYMNSVQVADKAVAFPKATSLEGFKTMMPAVQPVPQAQTGVVPPIEPPKATDLLNL
jgi:DNA-directed RNA polymerase beta subunit